MGTQEIERKFLLRELPDLAGAQSARLRQGYITHPGDVAEMRLRQQDDTYVMTFKSGVGAVRVERETEITKAQFDTFWPETEGRRIEKTRWTGALPDGSVFELDVFEGALKGLTLVEVEFPDLTAARAFEPPEWFGADVTDDRRYRNKIMAVEGVPT